MSRTLFVGDVHGCADELRQLLALAQAERVIFVGDLFTKGPDPRGVYELCVPHEGVLGNHDDRLLRAAAGERPEDRAAFRTLKALEGTAWHTWCSALPLVLKVPGFKVVHGGLDPQHPKRTTRRQALYLRQYPPGGRYWWQQYQGKRGVIFGHDARRGLVRVERAGEPYLLGLDTGCVYGGKLTGWLQEEDRYLQIRGRRYQSTG